MVEPAAFGAWSEVGRLRRVLVCEPGLAHERLTPSNREELLFDDVLWVEEAQRDHALFVAALEAQGVEVLELHDVLAETLAQPGARDWLLDRKIVPDEVGPLLVDPTRAHADGLDDAGQHPDRGGRGVEVVPAVVGHLDRGGPGVDGALGVVGPRDALDAERQLRAPLLAQPRHVGPGGRGREHPLAVGAEERGGSSPPVGMFGTVRSGIFPARSILRPQRGRVTPSGMYLRIVFQSIFSVARPMGDAMQAAVGWVGTTVSAWMPPGDLRSLVVDGVIAGVGSVIVFLPQIAMLFLFIGVLEDSGYMARAAFLMDGVMRRVGLHGKSFIPMLSGYACAVPGIMATRTVEHEKDRLATIMVVPLMSCSARLPVYTLLIGAFVPAVPLLGGLLTLQGAAMLTMYLLGTVTALGAAALFKRTLLRGPVRPMILELPPYRRPSVRSLAISVAGRAKLFLQRAGTVILALSVVLWAAATYPKTPVDPRLPEPAQKELQLEHSALGRLGHAIEPAVRPLGYDWKIGVSIAASFAAREVFVSTMGTIYGVGEDDGSGKADAALRDRLRADRDARTGRATYTPLVALGLMVFYVYALMCMSTVAVTVRETGGGAAGWRWAAVQFGYMLALAYVAALVVYQGGRLLGLG